MSSDLVGEYSRGGKATLQPAKINTPLRREQQSGLTGPAQVNPNLWKKFLPCPKIKSRAELSAVGVCGLQLFGAGNSGDFLKEFTFL